MLPQDLILTQTRSLFLWHTQLRHHKHAATHCTTDAAAAEQMLDMKLDEAAATAAWEANGPLGMYMRGSDLGSKDTQAHRTCGRSTNSTCAAATAVNVVEHMDDAGVQGEEDDDCDLTRVLLGRRSQWGLRTLDSDSEEGDAAGGEEAYADAQGRSTWDGMVASPFTRASVPPRRQGTTCDGVSCTVGLSLKVG